MNTNTTSSLSRRQAKREEADKLVATFARALAEREIARAESRGNTRYDSRDGATFAHGYLISMLVDVVAKSPTLAKEIADRMVFVEMETSSLRDYNNKV